MLAQWVAVAAAVWVAAQPAPRQEPTLATVLARAAAYVAEFHRQLSSIVAEERYVQDWKAVPRQRERRHERARRTASWSPTCCWSSRPAPRRGWQFRDVFEVDGAPVRDRDERLTQLFLDGSPSTDAQIRRILDESARYNIGDIQRNVNTPIFPLLFLERANHFRFKFKRTDDRTPTTDAGRRRRGRRVPRLDRSLGGRVRGESSRAR